MQHAASIAVTVSEPDITSGTSLEHVGEILGSCTGISIKNYLGFSHYPGSSRGSLFGLPALC